MPAPRACAPRLAAVRRPAARARVAGLVASPAPAREPRAVLAFLPEGGDDNPDPVLDRLAARPQARDRARQRDAGPLHARSRRCSTSRPDRARRPPSTSRATSPRLELVPRRRRQRLHLRLEQGARARATGARGDRAGPAGEPHPRRRARYAGVAGRTQPRGRRGRRRDGDIAASRSARRRDARRARAAAARATTASSSSGCRRPPRATPCSTGCCATAGPATCCSSCRRPPRAFVPQLLPAGAILPDGGQWRC